ncbi:MAG: hypothetical protein HPM95_07885 [Alphaproteobacteria bacterium]|nr:hypothetical protein [Alphaproteobacteria bacterium]
MEDQIYGFHAGCPDGVLAPCAGAHGAGFRLSKLSRRCCVSASAAGPVERVRHIEAVLNATSLMVSPLLRRRGKLGAGTAGIVGARRVAARRIARRADYCHARLPGLTAMPRRRDRLAAGSRHLTADGFAAEAASFGVRVSPARHFCVEPRTAPQAVRLCLANVAQDARYEEGIDRLAALLAQAPRTSSIMP